MVRERTVSMVQCKVSIRCTFRGHDVLFAGFKHTLWNLLAIFVGDGNISDILCLFWTRLGRIGSW